MYQFTLAALAVLLITILIVRLNRRARQERDARVHAEGLIRLASHLHELAGAVSRARTVDEVVEMSIPELLHAVRAEAGFLAIVSDDGQRAEVARAVGYDEPLDDETRRFPLSAHTQIQAAVQQREIKRIDSGIVVPLVTAGRVVGVFVLKFKAARSVDANERQFLCTAGRRTAEALVRAQVYNRAERARVEAEDYRRRADEEIRERQKAEAALRESETKYRALAARTSRLYALSAALSESITLDAVAKAIVRHGKIVVGASAGSVTLLVDGGTQFETLYAEDYARHAVEASERFPVEPGLCSTAAVETLKPVLVGSFADWQERYPRSASIAADGGFASAAALPLVVEESAFGVLAFHFTVPVNFDDEYRALLVSVAQHCAQALDRARLYEATQRARVEAETANRSKDDFLSTVSHELRTPLTAVLGWASMLRTGSLDPTRITRAIEAICVNATRQAQMIDELLDVSRIVAGRAALDLQDLNLRDSIRSAVEAVMPIAAAKRLELRLGVPPSVPVTADPRRLEQIFLNLLSNAVKFTPPGGSIAVDVRASVRAVDVRIADSGAGIDPDFLPHVFDRFSQAESTTARSAGGLGLGLFIARNLVEAQGGSIRAESAGPGAGAAFVVRLPIASETHPRRTAAPGARSTVGSETRSAVSLAGVRVLVVDDEADVREVMTVALEKCGATVRSVASACEAIKALTSSHVDVLLADIAMPDQDGYDLIRQVRTSLTPRTAKIPAVAVTACAREDERQRILAAGFQLHLAKPLDPARLAQAVAHVTRTGTSAASSSAVETGSA